MKENLIKRWAHSPWHAWFKDHPAWLDLFAELITKLPEPALSAVFQAPRTLIVLPPVYGGRIIRIPETLPSEVFILQLDQNLIERPREEALGVLAHELAHICAPSGSDALANDLSADRLVIQWGFAKELTLALKKDVCELHPRRIAAENSSMAAA